MFCGGHSECRPCVQLPWEAQFTLAGAEHGVESALWLQGVYDLALSEMLWRLIAPGEVVADIGANIGYVTSIMAAQVGSARKGAQL